MKTNLAVAGSFHENLFNYQQFHLRELRIIWGGRAIFSLYPTSPCRPYVTTMKEMQFNEDFRAFPMKDFQNHYFLVFDSTSLQDAAEQLHYPELCGESLRLEMFFQFPLEQVTEVIVLRKRLSIIQIDKFGTAAKNVYFFEFSGYYKIIVTFLGLFFVIISVQSILSFFRPKAPENIEKDCCLLENSRNFFNLVCRPLVNNFCPL